MRTNERTLYPGLGQMVAGLRNVTVSGILKALVRAVLNRRDLHRLRELDDAQLLDIGLTRHDIDRAFTSTFFENAFTDLRQSARGRARRMERM